MLSTAPPLLLLAVLQAPPVQQPPDALECEGRRRIELATTSVGSALEVCISPGLVTNFIFDAPVVVDLQDETRFIEVTRGRGSVNVIPAHDMVPGERLRLTAHLGTGTAREDVTLTLVAHAGQATHQVDVYRDPRSRESLREELSQERGGRLALQAEVERLRQRLSQSEGLLGLISSKRLGLNGIQAQGGKGRPVGYSENQLTVTGCTRYRSDKSVAAEVWLRNSGEEPWTVTGASLIAGGESMPELTSKAETIAPNTVGHILVEIDAERTQVRGTATLRLWQEGSRIINIPEVTFPE